MNTHFKTLFSCLSAAGLLSMAISSNAHDHPIHKISHDHHSIQLAQADTEMSQRGISGQGDLKFRVLSTRDILPEEAQAVLEQAHGGFAVDRRAGKGDIYFSLPGAGIIHLSPDLKQAKLIATADDVKNNNQHNTTIWYDDDGDARLVFPANGAGKVFTTSLEGELLDTLEAPSTNHDFDNSVVNEYFESGGSFVPTDVEYLNDMYYITTGYSKLDYVLTAMVNDTPLSTQWHDLVFGGKGEEAGQFQTGHGITVAMDGKRLDIADRPVAQIDRFDRYGHYRETLTLPEGAYPCDIDHAEGYSVVGCLHGLDREKGAPVYILKDGEVVSTIWCKEELGLEKFQHIHNAVITKHDGKLHLVIQSWNPGDFVVLEQVTD